MSFWKIFKKKGTEASPKRRTYTEDARLKIPHSILPGDASPEKLLELWKNADAGKEIPVLLVLDDTFFEMLDMNTYEEGTLPDIEAYLKPFIHEVLEDEEYRDYLGDKSNKSDGVNRFLSFDFKGESNVALALVPSKNPWEIFRYLPFGGFNACPEPNMIAAFCKEMYDRFGAVPAVMSGDTLELVTRRRPEPGEAFDLALKMYAFCPDIVTQGVGTIHALADSLMSSDIWYFWWD